MVIGQFTGGIPPVTTAHAHDMIKNACFLPGFSVHLGINIVISMASFIEIIVLH